MCVAVASQRAFYRVPPPPHTRSQALDVCVDLIRSRGLPSQGVQASMQLLKFLLRRHAYAMRFVNRDGVGALLSLPADSHFAGACCTALHTPAHHRPHGC